MLIDLEAKDQLAAAYTRSITLAGIGSGAKEHGPKKQVG
jgi:hypothetical protein